MIGESKNEDRMKTRSLSRTKSFDFPEADCDDSSLSFIADGVLNDLSIKSLA